MLPGHRTSRAAGPDRGLPRRTGSRGILPWSGQTWTWAWALALLAVGGCRADDEACRDVARHVAELAAAEGKGGPGSEQAIEGDCRELRPTRTVAQCMLAAQHLADLGGC